MERDGRTDSVHQPQVEYTIETGFFGKTYIVTGVTLGAKMPREVTK